jgi:hypothetical protein
MTLFASFVFQGAPIFLGDILISSPATQSANVSTPLVHNPGKYIHHGSSRRISSTCQKVNIINDNICLCWAGSFLRAKLLANFLVKYSQDNLALDRDNLYSAIAEYLGFAHDLKDFEFLICFWDGTDIHYFSNFPDYDLDNVREVRAAGSGVSHFLQHIERAARDHSGNTALGYNELALDALGYIGLASAQQFFSGHGLDEWWGGAFEIVTFSDWKFMKAGPICWLYWDCVEIGPCQYTLTLMRPFMYQYYIDSYALFWIDMTGEENSLHYLVDPIFDSKFDAETIPDRPTSFDTTIVVSLTRITCLDGEIDYSVRAFTGPNVPKRFVTISWSAETNTTSLGISDRYISEVLRPLPLSPHFMVDVDVWGTKSQFVSDES